MSEENTTRPALGYSEADGIVTLRMMRDDYNALMMCLGSAASKPAFTRMSLRVANHINRGNRAYRPYDLPDAPPTEDAET